MHPLSKCSSMSVFIHIYLTLPLLSLFAHLTLSLQRASGDGSFTEWSDNNRRRHWGSVCGRCQPCHDRENPQWGAKVARWASLRGCGAGKGWSLRSACCCPKLSCSKYGLWSCLLTHGGFFADTTYVLGNYKTEQCKKPPRLCRQGYACPYYHNSKDRRRSPRKHKYRYCGPGYCTSQLSGAGYWKSVVQEAGFWPLDSCF